MAIDYRKEVDSGYDRKRIVENSIIECLKSGIPLEIIKNSKTFNIRHTEMLNNLKKGYYSKLDQIVDEYNLYNVDPFEYALSDDYSKVSHPVGGELYPMTQQETFEKFQLLTQYNNQIMDINNIELENLEIEYNRIVQAIVDFKNRYPIIDNIVDCIYIIENETYKKNGNLKFEEIDEIYRKNGLQSEKLKDYNIMFSQYKKLEKKLNDISREYNGIINGKSNNSKTYEIQKLKVELEKEIMLRNTKLVNAFIRLKFKNLVVESDDLFQTCYLGLLTAVKNFDLSKNCKFSTYAYICMNTAVKNNFKQLTGLKWKDYWNKKYIEKQLIIFSKELGHQVGIDELKEFGVLPMSVKRAKALVASDYSLPGYSSKIQNDLKEENEMDFDYYNDDEYENELLNENEIEQFPYEEIDRKNLKENLNRILSTLSKTEEKVIRLRYGLDDGICRTLQDLSEEFNVSTEILRGIETRILRKLRHPLNSKYLLQFYYDESINFVDKSRKRM